MVTAPRPPPASNHMAFSATKCLLSSAEMHSRQHTVLTRPPQTNFISHWQGALYGPPEAAAGSPW